MVKTIINEEVILSYPDGFEEMEGRSSIRAVTSAAASSTRRSADAMRTVLPTSTFSRGRLRSAKCWFSRI